MDYKAKYLKYKHKYFELKKIAQQKGGRDFTPEEAVKFASSSYDEGIEMAKKIANEYGPNMSGDIKNPLDNTDRHFVTKIPNLKPRPEQKVVKHVYSPVLFINDLRPGDRVMKVKYTSDVLSGYLGDKGTVFAVEPLTNTVTVQLDRFLPQRLLSYIPISALQRIYDEPPRMYPRRRTTYYEDDDDLFDDEEEDIVVRKRKPTRKTARKNKTSKKSKKSKKSKSKSKTK